MVRFLSGCWSKYPGIRLLQGHLNDLIVQSQVSNLSPNHRHWFSLYKKHFKSISYIVPQRSQILLYSQGVSLRGCLGTHFRNSLKIGRLDKINPLF
ncbi:MAG: hypothetical protein [Olavius algarvensis Gamma 1 endosymbiont]|nr:MAG: hypothetical protein [Olavius algarvensis Gamma 1 endosymbiont]